MILTGQVGYCPRGGYPFGNEYRRKEAGSWCARTVFEYFERDTACEIIPEGVPAWAKRDALVSRLRGRSQTPPGGRDRDPWNVEEREQLCGDSWRERRADRYRAGAQEAASTKDL